MTVVAAPPRARRSTVTVAAQPMWRIRLTRGTPRYLLYATCLAGLLASARFAIAPPSPRLHVPRATTGYQPDLGGEGFASLFARRYLSWNSAEPQQRGLEESELGGRGAEAVDLRPPASGAQRVLWAQVVQARVAQPGVNVYTVAAETDAEGLVYLTVPVARLADGRLALAGYPAFVGPPASAPARLGAPQREVGDPTLLLVVSRALRNYLAGSADELSADLTSGARVSLPTRPLNLESVERASWTPAGRTVLATVRAADRRGVEYTLGYELDVTQAQGRWEVAAVQMDPDA
jgi:hypothetical protein